jgi:SlyX protein
VSYAPEMSDSDGVAARVTELESRYTLQNELLQQLSDVVFAQQKELATLALRLSALERRQVHASIDLDQREPEDDPPPHY